ncbi:MAG TPA: glycosyltransferase [Puia sp.]|nr:glycosyltransferase [Puia sp.]
MIGIKRENWWLRRFIQQEGLDLVISDNRFGLYGRGVFSVFMTHQLAIRSSFGGVVDGWLRRMNYNFIRRFSVCWVPDVEGPDNLAGKLSHPARMPAVPVRYIGWLSRLGPVAPEGDLVDLLILLSGPEPQRTILERLLLAQLSGEMGKIVLVRGLPDGGVPAQAPAGVRVYDYLRANDLERLICRSRLIVTRSGYSTVMDLAQLGKRAIFVPTPGQPEQEYLGRYLEEKGLGISVDQRGLALKEAIQRADLLTHGHQWVGNDTLGHEIARVLTMARSAQSAAADLG